MTNFDIIKKKSLEEILLNCGYAEDVHIIAFMNMFQNIPCRCCPVLNGCNKGIDCQKQLNNWLKQEAEERENAKND